MTTNVITLDSNDSTAKALVSHIKSAVNSAAKYAAYVEAHGVTRDTVADHARALAVLAYPNDKPVQKADGKRTRFGNAVQAAGKGLRTALADEDGATRSTGTQNLLTRDGVTRLSALVVDGGVDAVMAAVLAELDARSAAPADGE